MKKDIVDRKDIELFVTEFYNKLAADEFLKSIFFERLGPDNWQPHLIRIVDFWEMVLLGNPVYKGQSFLPHATMNLTQQHFDKWLAHFESILLENFEGEKTTEAISKANTMAILFMSKINYYNNNNATPLL